MNICRWFDDLVFTGLEAFVVWCEEWLSVSQMQIEVMLTILWIVLKLTEDLSSPLWIGLLFDPFVGTMIYFALIRASSKIRALRRADQIWMMIRVLLVGIGVFVTLSMLHNSIFVKPHLHQKVWVNAVTVDALCYIYYSIAIGVDGELGRRRKLALQKLKDLAGMEWVSKPLPIPQ